MVPHYLPFQCPKSSFIVYLKSYPWVFFQSLFSKCDPRDPRFETFFDLAEVQEILGSYIYFAPALIQIYTYHLTLHKYMRDRAVCINEKLKGNFKIYIYIYDFEFFHIRIVSVVLYPFYIYIYIPWIGGHTHI